MSSLDSLQARFKDRFLDSARNHLAIATSAIETEEPGSAGRVEQALHTLAGEAAVIGFNEIAATARAGEEAAALWKNSEPGAQEKAEAAARTLSEQLDALGR